MKKLSILSFLALVTMVFSCTPVLKIIYGMHNPKPETKKNLNKYIEKQGISVETVYYFTDSNSFYNYYNQKWQIPKISIYNHNHLFLRIIEKDTCVNQRYEMAENLSIHNNYQVDSSEHLLDILNQFETKDGKKIDIDNGLKTDFYIVIHWAKFTGKLNKRDVKSWNKTFNNKKNKMNIEIFYLCCDPLKSWWSEN